MEEPFRVRMVFDDRKILSKSQRSEGLKRCWLLLSPKIATISDLESHVRMAFDLKRSCPNGIVLSMDDFVLPPFESASILKDSDIIRVRKKDTIHVDVINLGHDPHYIQDSGVLEKQHTVSCDTLLAIKEFGEDSGRKRKHDKDLSAHDENATCMGTTSRSKNKRKHSDEIQGSKMKKLKTADDEDIPLEKALEYSQSRGSSPKSSKKKNKPSTVDERPGDASDLDDNVEHVPSSRQKKKRMKKLKTSEEEDIHLKKALEYSQNRGSSPKSSKKENKPSTVDERPGAAYDLEDDVEHMTSSRQKKKRGKKSRLIIPEMAINTIKVAENVLIDQNPSCSRKGDGSAERLHRKDKQSDEDGRSNAVVSSRPHDNVSNKPTSVLMDERNVQTKENIEGATSLRHVSRSARRKKAKRELLKELKSQQRQNTQSQIQLNTIPSESPAQQETVNNSQNQAVFVPGESQQQQETEKDGEPDTEIVPVIIRPGHIRFQPVDDEQNQLQSHEMTESLPWNGTTSKRKGQKWGQEKTTSNWNDANGFADQSHGKAKNVGKWNNANGYAGQQWARERTVGKWNDSKGSKGLKWSGDKFQSRWNTAENYKEHCNGKENFVRKWTDANGEEQCNTKATSWGDANRYTEQSNRNAVSEKGKTDANGEEQCNTKATSWGDANRYTEQSNRNAVSAKGKTDDNGEEQCNTKATSWGDANGYTKHSNRNAVSEKGKTGSKHPNFESLFPLTRIPQVGDVLAYRLIELSPSWCPEVSSFRVGQVTSYNYLNMSIILVPVPEYPIFSDEEMDIRESILQANSSQYNEDGSLQIHYPSLIDVRLLKASESEAVASDHPGGEMSVQEAAPVNNSNANYCGPDVSTQETPRGNNWEKSVANGTAKETVAQPTENGNGSGSTWDEIKQALNEKKAELQKKKDGWDEWTPRASAAGTSWSYTALRRSAVGPTLAYLRGKNNGRRPKK